MTEITGRPRRLTPEMALSAARKTAASLAKNGLIAAKDIEEHAADIAKHGREHMDGYELAKVLDDRCYWDCDLMMAEELDGFSSDARSELDVAEKQWAAAMNITAPFPLGTRVTLKGGEVGTLDTVYEHGAAKYCIAIDGGPANSRRIVNFEDVTPLAQAGGTEGRDAPSRLGAQHEHATPIGDAP